MKKVTVTITGLDKKTVSYIVEKIGPIPGGLAMELGEPVKIPAPDRETTRKELVILTPFYEDHSLCSRPPWYRTLTPLPQSKNVPRQYCFKAPFNLRERLIDMQNEFSIDLMDRVIIFCVKRKGTENNWRSSVQRIEQGEEHL